MAIRHALLGRLGRPAAQLLLALGLLALPAAARASAPPPALERDSWLLRLEGEPLWKTLRRAQDAGEPLAADEIGRRLAARAAAQDRYAAAAADLGADVIDRYQLIANGLLLHADAQQARLLSELDGVAGVAPAPVLGLEVRDLRRTVKADQVAETLGLDGTGATVAVIDTGIDYEHAMLGGGGDPAAYLENDENKVERGSFPTTKVTGGYDFAGPRYSAACGGGPDCPNRPQPDADPLDPAGLGHGSHVAGIIAGQAAGPRVPAGMAPGARLVALKIFGNPQGVPATSDLALSALEWAVKHNAGLAVPGSPPKGRIDVVNLSLGTDWSARMVDIEEAVANVVDAGIIVVASAGNAGPLPYVTGSPGSASMALSVASSVPRGVYEPRVAATWRERDGRFTTEPIEVMEAAPDWLPGFGELPATSSDLAWLGDACQPIADLRLAVDRIALIERGGCTFFDKLLNAAKAGAIGAVVFTDGAQKVTMACAAPTPCGLLPPIPAGMIDREPGIALRDRLLGGAVVRVALEARWQEQLTDTISDFSSRGPARFDAAIKPDITAPGTGILSARAGGGTRLLSMSGTSMAGPAVAGMLALLWQRNQRDGLGLDAAEVAALAMNYADPAVRVGRRDTGPTASVARQGAGRADALQSARGQTVVRGEVGLAGLSFGHVHVGDGGARLRQTLRVRNLAPFGQRYRPETVMSFPEDDAGAGLGLSFDPPILQLPPRSEGTIEVTLTVDAPALRAWRLRSAEPLRDEARLAELEFDGYVRLVTVDTDGRPVVGGDRPGLPFHALPRHHACLASATAMDITFWEEGESAAQGWLNGCGRDGAVEAFALAGRDPAESTLVTGFPPKLDLQAVGVRYGLVEADESGSIVLGFALKTRGSRRIPAEAELRVLVDADRDGDWDRVLYNRHAQAWDDRLPAGSWLVLVAPVQRGTLAPDEAAAKVVPGTMVYDLDETVTMLAAPAAMLGVELSAGRAVFDWGAIVLDAVGDHPLRPGYPGFDLLPDGLAGGARLRFDQRAAACLAWTDGEGRPLARVGQSLRLAAGARADSQVRLACPPEDLGPDAGLFMHYPDNPPAQQLELRLARAAIPGALPSASPLPSPSASPVILPPSAPPPTWTPVPTATAEPSALPSRQAATATATVAATATTIASATAAGTPDGTLRLSLRQAVGQAALPPVLVAGWPAYLEIRTASPEAVIAGSLALDGIGPDDAPLPGSPLRALAAPAAEGAAAAAAPLTGFLLPPQWTAAGRIRMRVTTGGGSELARTEAVFAAPGPLVVDVVPVALQPGGVGAPLAADMARDGGAALGWLGRALPLPIAPRLHPAWRFDGLVDKPRARQALLHQLALLRLDEQPGARLDGRPDNAPLVLGLLPPGGASISMALPGGSVALASADDPLAVARAVGLALGLPPVACDLAAADEGAVDRSYPYVGGRIGALGLDLGAWRYLGADAYDLMSGCAPAWLSDHHLSRLLQRLRDAAEAAAAPAGAGWRLSGQWQADSGRLSLDPLRQSETVMAAAAPPGGAPLAAALLDEAGRELWSAPLPALPQVSGLGRTGSASFAATVPRLAAAASLVVRAAAGGELARLPLDGAAARLDAVLLPLPAGGRTATLYARVLRAGKVLSAPLDLRYSADGRDWRLLQSGVVGERLTVDLTALPAAAAGQLELRAVLDGRPLAQRLSLGTLPGHAPTALVLGAAESGRSAGTPILLAGAGLDADGAVSPERLRWEVSGTTIRRNGPLFFLAEGLPAGRHRLRLTVLDEAGLPGAARDWPLPVGPEASSGARLFLPRALRGR